MKRILIIEDCEDVRGVIKDILKARGYAVLEAPNPSEAYQIVSIEKPDTILCDTSLEKEGDGLELAIQLVKEGIIKKNNIIGMSGDPWRKDDWEGCGIAFIEIPFRLNNFYRQVEEH